MNKVPISVFLYVCLVNFLLLPSTMQGQKVCGFIDNSLTDPQLYRHELARSRARAYSFNGAFIKSDIGLPPDSVWKYSHEKWNKALTWEEVPGPVGMNLIFNGVGYRSLRRIRSDYWFPHFVSLQDIKDCSYGKNIFNGVCFFMFDDVFLPYDVKSYLFDSDYIDSMRIYRMGRGEILRDTCPEYNCREAIFFRIFSTDYAKWHAPQREDTLHADLPRVRTQFEEDANRSAIFLNGTFVGSTLGLNLDSLTRIGGKNAYRVTVTQEPYEAGGVCYVSRTYIECKHYRPELVQLTSLAEKFPGIGYYSGAPNLYIVDNMLILNPQNVWIDRGYISVIRGFLHNEIETLPNPVKNWRREASGTSGGVLQIYVKNAEYVKNQGIRRII